MENEGGSGDIGLPGAELPPGGKSIGLMTTAEADKLAAQVKGCDLLVVAGPRVPGNLTSQIGGEAGIGAILVLNDVGLAPRTEPYLYALTYDIKEAAYLLGVAAGVSSRTQAFAMFTSTTDPNADTLYKAFANGVRNRMSGGNVYLEQITPDIDDILAPADFTRAFEAITHVPGRKIDHFIAFCGRATPSIMYGLSSKPTNGYLLGGYGDFTQVRPARVVGCIVKHPGVGLRLLLEGAGSPDELKQRMEAGITLDLKNGGVDVTDFKAYANYNPDAEDIEEAVAQARSEIAGGEIDVLQD
jgi:hypothetical protein